MTKISCLVLNITKLKKKNVFVASRNFYSVLEMTSFRGGIILSFTQIGPKVPRVINMNFLSTISKRHQKKRLGEVIN